MEDESRVAAELLRIGCLEMIEFRGGQAGDLLLVAAGSPLTAGSQRS
jgi:hypothetical protein